MVGHGWPIPSPASHDVSDSPTWEIIEANPLLLKVSALDLVWYSPRLRSAGACFLKCVKASRGLPFAVPLEVSKIATPYKGWWGGLFTRKIEQKHSNVSTFHALEKKH